MSVDVFLDTNVLIYAASGAASEIGKSQRAREIMAGEEFGISTQTLQEFFAVATSKVRIGMPPPVAQKWLSGLRGRPCIVVDEAIIDAAIGISIHFRINYWDGAIIAAAQALGAPVLYTEDLSHNQDYGGVRVVNPFV
jgi:predicted nucleic acid-binding protein